MPTKIEKDSVTGTETTGHEWDGIKELNTPLPKWWLYVLYVCIAWSVVYWVLYPSWPGINGYFGGLLGGNQRLQLDERMAEARAGQAVWLDRLEAAELAEITDDPDLFNYALAGGEIAFQDNCAPCHGLGGAGQGFYPSLADDEWIWGGTLDDIHTTLLYGIRHDYEDTRISDMPRFGADEILTREEITDVAEFVTSLTDRSEDAEAAERGRAIYADQCSFCHGEAGEGMAEVGAPALNDQIWLYGGDKADIVAQLHRPQQGVMPGWLDRLDPEVIKMATIYVHTLGGGQ